MSQTQKLGKVATTVRNDSDYTIVRYHLTDVVKFDSGEIVLNSGEWRTATTKLRINQASNQYGLGIGVYQDNGEWFVRLPINLKGVLFKDGMIINRQTWEVS